MSQDGYPKYLKLPNGEVVAAFNLEQLEAIQRVLIIWDNLEFENYKLEQRVETLSEQVKNNDELIDAKNIEIAKLDGEVRISKGISDHYKALYEEQKGETQKWSVAYNKEEKRKKRWRNIAVVSIGVAVVETVILVGVR